MNKIQVPKPFEPLFFFANPNMKRYRYYLFPGGRASGKTTDAALALVLEAASHPIRILCAREYQNSIRDSVKRVLEDVIKLYGFEGFTSTLDSLKHENGSEFIFKGLHNDPETALKGLEGVTRCWVEEAQFISARSLDVLIPTIRRNGSTIIFTYNPLTHDDPVTRRFVTHATELDRQRTYMKHTTWRTLEKAGLLNQEVKLLVEAAKGTPEFAHVWEGLPMESATNQIITWNDLDNATKRAPDLTGSVTFGVDVARYGNDRTALAIKKGTHLARLISWQHTSLIQSAETIQGMAQEYHPTLINLDDTGVGGGLTDILLSKKLPVQGINYAQSAKEPDKYPNAASELWFDFASKVNTISIDPNLDQLAALMQELSTREWKINNKGQRQVQSKADYKNEQVSGSPDLADAVLLAYYEPPKLPNWDYEI